ncbi:hypothetical protein FRB96_000364 [Tulasnella sp. 330]|nr:hypothetical protein FRB96_000364 [Tulasnella sp. 330]KAG8885006.1 hypothetical protein FRB97_002513 [Tulasnella sp. 331]
MGIFFLASRAISLFAAFLYPAYETFKTLANRPGYEKESSRWLMYWAVIAVLVTYEYSCEFLISWFPFYYEFKTFFLLFLVLPQTQGSTIIYQKFMLPFLLENEPLVDRQLASVQGRALSTVQEQFQRVLHAAFGWQATAAAADIQHGPRGIDGLGGTGMGFATPANGIPGTPGAAAAQAAQALWNSYGPTAMATGASLRPAGASATPRDSYTSAGNGSDAASSRPSMPSGRSSAASSLRSGAPSPQLSGTAQRPRPRQTSKLPEHPAPVYTRGYSEVNGE